MTAKQTALYFREWGKVHKRYPDVDRHDLHTRALGSDKSSKAFTNRDLDLVLAEFRALTDPDSVDAQLRQIEQPRTRLLWKIDHYLNGLRLYVEPQSYLAAILRDQFTGATLADLSETQLKNLRNTLSARLQTHRKAARKPVEEPF